MCCCLGLSANDAKPKFRVIGFFTGKQDQAHISFLHEAERWFPEMAAKYNFSFDTTSNWSNLTSDRSLRPRRCLLSDTNQVAARVYDCEFTHTPGLVPNGVQTRYARLRQTNRTILGV